MHHLQGRIQDFSWGRQPIIPPYFPENCMKMKEIGPRGDGHPKFYFADRH